MQLWSRGTGKPRLRHTRAVSDTTPPHPVAVSTAGQVRFLPLCRPAPLAASAHTVLHTGLGDRPQRPPLPLDLPGEGPGVNSGDLR